MFAIMLSMMELMRNKKAFFDYEILEEFQAGIVLKGYEAKAIRSKKVNLKGGYVSFRNDEAWLTNIQIDPYQPKNQPEADPKAPHKLLLEKREIAKLISQAETTGITVIPLKLILKNNRIKIVIGLCRGKKKFDKRETIKKRELDREIKRRIK